MQFSTPLLSNFLQNLSTLDKDKLIATLEKDKSQLKEETLINPQRKLDYYKTQARLLQRALKQTCFQNQSNENEQS